MIACLALTLVLAAAMNAQDDPTFSADAKVVSLLASVRDRNGGYVSNLAQDDFTLFEDGKPQKIRYFSRETDLPLTLGLVVDTSQSQAGVLERERRAGLAFLDRMLRPDDRAFIAHFDERVEILQGLTASRPDLEAALARLRIPPHLATLIFSAVRDTSENPMRKQPGRKALILLTDGVEFRDKASIGTAIEFAQRADCIVYSIRYSDAAKLYRPVRAALAAAASERGKTALRRMAAETGGAMYEVTKTQPLEAIFANIESVLRHQYSIGYAPTSTEGAAGYRKLRLSVKDANLVVTTRDGYYAR